MTEIIKNPFQVISLNDKKLKLIDIAKKYNISPKDFWDLMDLIK